MEDGDELLRTQERRGNVETRARLRTCKEHTYLDVRHYVRTDDRRVVPSRKSVRLSAENLGHLPAAVADARQALEE